ncbi:hypothetical protein Z946_3866 [Sulfitobacter noctilucicola]|uniref:DUF2867 domain-containing protein n=1 Tax=Sulfitobacter noctilucicola TaxID=1342301 RepID=A0A7W6Q476_9RHOB|nr:hypothetical protein [Sulfitobacter noctilucicola]KIN64970.1 hypothetical protein Z946_3866 [Sulfitobacter noctilucicola]MBB4173889.1 hypothetical protein [Sulfitobacter noctilucicola]
MIARAVPVPRDALLRAYVDRDGAYTDCFEVMHPMKVELPAFITAFYSTWLFRLERLVLSIAMRRRISDSELAALAEGRSDRFAAWQVTGRDDTQIMLQDTSGHTMSYLAVAAKEGGVTRLLFGSVVHGSAEHRPAWVRLLMPVHLLYAKSLLRCAERKLRRG